MAKKAKCMADGGIIGADGMTEAQRAKRNAALQSLGMSTAQPPVQSPPAMPQPVPVTHPAEPDRPRGIMGILGGRGKQIDKASGYANGGIINNAAEYWANDNAEFEKTNPNIGRRLVRAINPLTGFGSAMGAMHTAAGNGDVPGMAMAGISAIPAFGVMRMAPPAGAMKAYAVPSAARSAAAVASQGVSNAASDEYQARQNPAYARGGIVRGKGGVDRVPMAIGGINVNLTGGKKPEAVLPGKTVEAMGGPSAVESLIEATNGKPPVKGGLKEGGNYRYGANGEWIPDPEEDKAPAGGQWATPNMPIPVPSQASVANDPMKISNPVLSASNAIDKGLSAVGNVFSDSATANREGTDYSTARANRLAGTPEPGSTTTQLTNPSAVGAQGELANPNYGNKGRSVPVPITKDRPGIVVDNNFNVAGKEYASAPTSQPGVQRITAPGTSPLYTNIDPSQADTGLNKPMNDKAWGAIELLGRIEDEKQIRGERFSDPNAPRPPSSPNMIDLAGQNDRMARSLGYGGTADFLQKSSGPQQQQQQQGGTYGGEPQITQTDIDNAEKTARWRQDDLISKLGRGSGSDAAIAAAINANARSNDVTGTNAAQLRAAALNNRAANNRDQVTMRGQDINERGDRLRYGNPLDIQAKQLSLTQAQRLSDIQGKYLNGTPEEKARAAEQIRALSGKDNQQSLKDNFMTAGGGQEFDEKAGIMRNVPQRLIDLRTGQDVSGQQQGPKRIGNSPYDEGASIVGKDGKKYVVRNGQPVLAQ